MRRLGVSAALVDGEVVPGDVELDGSVIAAVGVSPAGHNGVAVPGYIDLQVNGFGDVDFLTADLEGFRHAGEVLMSTGVTSYQPTLVTSPEDTLLGQIDVVAKAQVDTRPRIIGVHLEGPFIAPKFKGAHDDRYIVPPDIGMAARLCATGMVSSMTIAPEQPGGFELLDWLVRHDILVSIGHTDADAATAHEAFNRGARSVTHLHNAQRRFTARDPGISAVAMTRADVTVELIPDLVHLAPETVLLAWEAARGRLAVVTDSISAAPHSMGEFLLGDRMIIVSHDAARLADGTLAGSVLSMDKAVRNLVSLGITWDEAVRAATSVPAKLFGHEELGTLRPRTPADVVILDDTLQVTQTILAGDEMWSG
ncbi:MAG: N-acetylglucosamine-6-phosphate deacetylase [Actinomycetota bacterium]